jgi:hypothetical protein
MDSKELLNQFCFVGGEVVQDDMNLLLGGCLATSSSRKATNS